MTIRRNQIIILAFLLSFVIFFQFQFLEKRYGERIIIPECPWCESEDIPDVIYVPLETRTIKLFSPADIHLIADILWVRVTYYFGEHALTDQKYPYLLHLLDMITDLSPMWLLPYHFGAVIIPTEADDVDAGIYMIDKGIDHHPDNWQLWFFKGYYQWENLNDYIAASQSLSKASMLPGAPVFLAALSATFATKAGQKDMAILFLEQALENVNDPAQRKILIDKLHRVIQSESDSHSMD